MVVYYASSEHTSSELYHHGIKGMRWGQRRFQNADGSLTAAGRVRYGVGKAGSGLVKLAKGAGSLSTKAGAAIGNSIKTAASKAKGDIRAKKVRKLTATKSDLAKNYDKLTPEERQAALAKFKFQDDLKDSMKKDWDRAVSYAKLTFDAIDTAKKIGDDVSLIATGKNLADLAKARNKDPNSKDKEYWEKELTKNKALQTQETAEKLRLENKKLNAGDVDTYSTGAKNKLERDAAEKAKAEAEEKKVERMQRVADAVDAVQSAPGKFKEAAAAAKEKYNDAADKFNDRVNKAYDAASSAAEKGKAVAGKAKDVAADAYNYTGEAVGKAGTKVYNAVEKSKGAAVDAYNYSGEAVGKAGTKVYNAANKAGAKIKEAAAAAKEKNRQAEESAARLTKAKAEALYKKAGSMAEAAKKAGCSPSTIRNFLGNVGKSKSKTSMSMKIKIVSPEEYNAKNKSNNLDDYTRDRIQKNQEMIDHGMEILDDILRHSDGTPATTFSEDDVASLFHGATFFDYADDTDILAHHGVKGMKWGVRRYQNPDGTLTAAGKERARNKRAGIDTTTKFTGVGDMLLSEVTTKAPVWAAMAKATAQAMAVNQVANMDQYIKASESMRYTDTVNQTSERVNHQAADFALAKFAAKGAFFAYTMNIPGLQSMALEGGLAGVSAIQKARFAKERAEAPIDKETGLRLKTKELTQFQDCQRVNPGFLSISDGTKNNCMLCTTAYELRRRGYDVQANKATIGYQFGDLKRWFPGIQVKSVKQSDMNLAERQVDRLKLRRDLYERTVAEITKQGDGARGNIMVSWAGGGGHSMAYEVQNGKLKVIDGQGGYIYPHAQLMTMMAYNVQYARLDNLKFDPKGIKEAVN